MKYQTPYSDGVFNKLVIFLNSGKTFTFRDITITTNNETALCFDYVAMSDGGVKHATFYVHNMAGYSTWPPSNDNNAKAQIDTVKKFWKLHLNSVADDNNAKAQIDTVPSKSHTNIKLDYGTGFVQTPDHSPQQEARRITSGSEWEDLEAVLGRPPHRCPSVSRPSRVN
jgi:hypothetical protein